LEVGGGNKKCVFVMTHVYYRTNISLVVQRSKIRQILCVVFILLPAASLSLYWIKDRFE